MKAMGQRMVLGQAILLAVCLLLAGLVGRLAYINGRLSPQLAEYSYRRQTSTVTIPGRRGYILDRRFRVLAGSQDRYILYADPRAVPDKAAAAEAMARVLGRPPAELRKKLEDPTSPGYVLLQQDLDEPQREGLEALAIEGVGVQREPGRIYPMGTLMAHVIGYVGKDGCGLEGIEKAQDRFLKAESGKRVVYRDVQRRALFQEKDSYKPPVDGKHVVLTIDTALQEKLEEQLKARVEFHNAENAVGVIMNPQTGEVLAMANYPTFDPSEAGEIDPKIRRNRLLTDPVEPGSIFKPYIMGPALAAGVVKPLDIINCQGGMLRLGGRTLKDHHAYGNLTVEQVMAKSSNIGMSAIGQKLGNAGIYQGLLNFGYNQPTGIDLPGEGRGPLMPLRAWTKGSTLSVPMGHELAVTPIQVISAFCAITNGGKLLKPRVVAAVLDEKGEILEDRSKPVERGAALDPQTAETMMGILTKVVTEGTGTACNLDRWQVLGKTGTAQIPRIGEARKGYVPGAYLASFIAAAPASDPQVAVLIMVRYPKKNNYYGSVVALPGVKAVLEFALPYLGIAPDKAPGDGHKLVADAHD